MSDVLTLYETGLTRLLGRLGRDHPRHTEALTLQARLLENIARARRYGDTETSRAERAQIVDALGKLALEAMGLTFSNLCTLDDPPAVRQLSGSKSHPAGRGVRKIQESDSRVKDLIELASRLPEPERLKVLREALAVAREIQDVESRFAVLTTLIPYLLATARAAGDRVSEASALGNLGLVYLDQGDAHRAIEHYEQQLAIVREIGDRRGEATALGNLGNAYADLGKASLAIRYYQQVLALTREIGDRQAEGEALGNLGLAHAAVDDLSHAVERYEQAISIARQLNDHYAEAGRLQNLGLALLRLADIEPEHRQVHLSHAAESLHQAVESFDALNAPQLRRARARYHLGRSYHRLGRWREAIELLEQARETFSRRKARPELAHTLLELGQLYHQYRDFESAYLYLKDALRLFRRLEDADGIAVTQEALGNLALQTARPAEAIASLQEARQSYVALKRRERIRAVDQLLRLAHQSHQIATRKGVAP